MKHVEFHKTAAREAKAAAKLYETIRAGLGIEFKSELDAALARLRHNTQLYPVERGTIRICPLHRFPYSIVYDEFPDRIWVVAIAHHSRRPQYWSRRRP